MKKNYWYIVSFVAFAFLMMSCADDEIIETPSISSPSETIVFGADIEWADPDQTRSASPNRVSNFSLVTDTGEEVLPCGVYVQDGIHPNDSEKPLTRGAVVNSVGDSFSVWATYTKDGVSSKFFEEVFSDDDQDDVFSSEKKYYWPGSGTIDFVAVANTPESNHFTYKMSDDGTKLESFTYTVPANATQQNDIIVATAKGIAGNKNASVPLSFKHIMSAVNVKIGSVVAGEIRSITFKNVYNKGKYLVDQGLWVVDKTSTENFAVVMNDDAVTMEDNKFVSSGSDAKDTPVNTAKGTFMFIPQNPGENAEMVIEFYDSETGYLYSDDATKNPYKPALRGSIAGDNWDKSKTVNYMLSIDESFTLTIEPVGKKLDAHYVIGYANVTVDGIDNWTIEATANDGADVTILPYSDVNDEMNPLVRQGFWTDYEVDESGNKIPDNSTSNGRNGYKSARGLSSWSGSGSITEKLFYIFIPENMGNTDRQINLTLRGTGASTASTTKVLLQKCPNWTTGGFGWEVVDDGEQGKYGFKWTRKVAIVYPYWRLVKNNAINQSQEYVDNYGAGENGFATVGTYSKTEYLLGFIPTTSYRSYIWLDYTTLNSIKDADSDLDGYANTHGLYQKSGTTATSQFETILLSTYKTESGHENEKLFRIANDGDIADGAPAAQGQDNDLSAALEYIQKKNRYFVQTTTISSGESDGSGKLYVPYFKEEDLKWYLPAYGQFQYFTPDPNIPGDDKANYWSSTAPSEDDKRDYAYIGSGILQDRDLEYRIIAVRKDENGYGNATVQINNDSLAGGDNGDSNTWVE